MKKQSIIQIIMRSDFRKVVNYYLNGRGKVTRIGTFSAGLVVFEVLTNSGDMLFSPDTNFSFLSASIKNGQIHSVWTFRADKLKYLTNTIDFFNRDEKSRVKMGFPEVTIYPFNERGDVANVTNCKAYQLAAKVNDGEKLTRDEKNWITDNVNKNSHSKSGIPVLGVMFNFSAILKTFVVKQYGRIQEYKAIDKTSIRAFTYGRIDYIKEI